MHFFLSAMQPSSEEILAKLGFTSVNKACVHDLRSVKPGLKQNITSTTLYYLTSRSLFASIIVEIPIQRL